MGIAVRTLHRHLGAEITRVDLSVPLGDELFRRIRDAFHEHAVLVFPDQAIDDERQIAFSLRFGPLETSVRKDRKRQVSRPEISDISNVDEHGRLVDASDERAIYNAGNQLWHSDSSFKPVPALASLLSAREVPPEGGETEFADMRAAWDALPEERRRKLTGLVAVHDLVYSRGLVGYDQFTEAERAAVPPVQQTLIRTHPATGRKSLYLGSHASRIVGQPVEEGRRLLRELLEFATRPDFVYRHAWRANDLVMWDTTAASCIGAGRGTQGVAGSCTGPLSPGPARQRWTAKSSSEVSAGRRAASSVASSDFQTGLPRVTLHANRASCTNGLERVYLESLPGWPER